MLFSAVLMLPAFACLLSCADLVADARLERKLLELLAPAVVQDVDVQLVRRPVDVQRAQRGVAHHIQRLVVRRNQYVDVRPFFFIVWQSHRRTAQRPDCLKIPEEQNEERVALGQDEAQDEKGVERSPMVGRIPKKLHGVSMRQYP